MQTHQLQDPSQPFPKEESRICFSAASLKQLVLDWRVTAIRSIRVVGDGFEGCRTVFSPSSAFGSSCQQEGLQQYVVI